MSSSAKRQKSSNAVEQSRIEIEKNVTLTQYILRERETHPEATGQFSNLMNGISTACKYISSKVRAAGLFELQGEEGTENATGDVVKKLDVISNDAFITALKRTRSVYALVSEEEEEVIFTGEKDAHYVVATDPLDGSSNIAANISIGTIFAVHRRADTATSEKDVREAAVLAKGDDMVCAGYCLYGSSTILVISVKGSGVHGFTLDPSLGEFVLSHPNMRIPAFRNIYSVNEGNTTKWTNNVQAYVDKVKNAAKPHSLRYVGSMVADVHRTLLYGGIFMYPADKKSQNGKLRLLYEANPMSFLCEQAGGRAIVAKGKRCLDLVPTEIHQRTPIFIGSVDNIKELEDCLQE